MTLFKKWASSKPAVNVKRFTAPPPPDGPERGLPTLPNELIPGVLTLLDSRSLYRVAQVSKRFNELSTRAWLSRHGVKPVQMSSGHIVIHSDLPGEAFSALRSALFLRARPLKGLTCIMPFLVGAKTIQQLDALLSWFTPPITRLTTTDIDFGADMIPHATSLKSTAQALSRLLSTIAADSPTTVFILQDGLFTCRPGALRRWNPATGHYESGWGDSVTTYANIHMHDGSHQRVPTIRSLQTLSTQYPLHPTAPAPFNQWKLVVIDAASLTDLQLSIRLASHEWDAVLDALALPALVCVGLWAETISTATSTRFFNRHPTLRTLKYISPTVDALPSGAAPLRLPRLESVDALAPYLIFLLSPHVPPEFCVNDADSDPDPELASPARFPRLTHIELRPELASPVRFPRLAHIELRPHARLPAALLLASTHTPLRALTLWSLTPAHLPAAAAADAATAWSTFPAVHRLTLNEIHASAVLAAGLPALLTHAFPALRHVEVNYSWAGNGDISRRQMAREQRAFVKQVKAASPGVHTCVFDGREQTVGGV